MVLYMRDSVAKDEAKRVGRGQITNTQVPNTEAFGFNSESEAKPLLVL